MLFETPWKTYSESEIDFHPGGGDSDPTIYISHDRCAVWVCPPTAQSLHLANLAEISELWDRLQLATLLSVLRVIDPKIRDNSSGGAALCTGSW